MPALSFGMNASDAVWCGLSGEAAQCAADVAFTQTLERAIAKLANSLACNAEHRTDFFERMLTSAFETEVETQHLCVTRRQCAEGLFDLIGEEAVHRLFLGVGHLVGDEALD